MWLYDMDLAPEARQFITSFPLHFRCANHSCVRKQRGMATERIVANTANRGEMQNARPEIPPRRATRSSRASSCAVYTIRRFIQLSLRSPHEVHFLCPAPRSSRQRSNWANFIYSKQRCQAPVSNHLISLGSLHFSMALVCFIFPTRARMSTLNETRGAAQSPVRFD